MAKAGQTDAIQALLKEGRKFPPSKQFVQAAQVKSAAIYKEAGRDPVKLWEKQAKQLRWMKPWKKTLEWKLPYAKWFVGGKLNVSDNCLDRHVEGARIQPCDLCGFQRHGSAAGQGAGQCVGRVGCV